MDGLERPIAPPAIAMPRRGDATDAATLQPVFITVDPKRDTREALAEYLKSFDPHIVVLTGTEEQIAAVVKEYRVFVEVQPGGGDYIVNHSSFYYLINPEGKFVRVIADDVSGEELAERLRHWMNKTV